VDQDFNDRYSRHFPLNSIGKKGQLKLQNRRVLIAGMGGLGTVSSELLASIGVGYLRLVDYDVIERSNLPRQKLYTVKDIGKSKVEVAETRLQERNPQMEIDIHATRIDALSANSLLEEIDLVIDGLDKFSSRRALFRVARTKNIPYIFTGAVAEQANIMTFTHADDKPCLICVIGNTGDDPEQSCEVRGVHPSLLSMAASIQVSEAVKVLLGKDSELDGKMLYIDLLDLSFDKIQFSRKENCRLCGSSATDQDELDQGEPGEITKGIRPLGNYGRGLVTSLCGRDTKIIDPNWEITWDFKEVKSKLGQEYHVATSGKKYITINVEGIGVSILDSGVSTIRGAKTAKRAIETFLQVYQLINQIK